MIFMYVYHESEVNIYEKVCYFFDSDRGDYNDI